MKLNKSLSAFAALPALSDIVDIERTHNEPAASGGWLGWLIAGAAVIAAAVLAVLILRARKKK